MSQPQMPMVTATVSLEHVGQPLKVELDSPGGPKAAEAVACRQRRNGCCGDHRIWDALVIGAGPAGAMAAGVLAHGGLRVLLVDKVEFPRYKVCGCCLNGLALASLQAVGLGELPRALGAPKLEYLSLASGGGSATIELPTGYALSRTVLDTHMVHWAIGRGAAFLDRTRATVQDRADADHRRVVLRHDDQGVLALAGLVVVADGLGGRSLAEIEGMGVRVRRGSRVGLGAVVGEGPNFYEAGTVYMAGAKGGYVGLVRLEDGKLNVAAAMSKRLLRNWSNPAAAVASVIASAGWPAIGALHAADFHGTAALSCRRRRVADERLVVVGDSAGYIEPFTGEGMAWALTGGLAAAQLAMVSRFQWPQVLTEGWNFQSRQLLAHRQRVCRMASTMMHHRLLRAMAIGAINRFPDAARRVVNAISNPARPTCLEGELLHA